MIKCTSCETLFPTKRDCCPKCQSRSMVEVKFQRQDAKPQEPEDSLLAEPISAMASHSVSNLWMNVSGL